MLDFPAFCALIGDTLEIDLGDIGPESRLDDLQIDSLCMIEILAIFDDHGIVLPDALIPELRTMGDLHHYFTVRSRPAAPIPPARGQTVTVSVAVP